MDVERARLRDAARRHRLLQIDIERREWPAVLAPAERAPVDAALDAAIERFRWQRRIAGDARKRNRILQLLYKGA